MHKDSLLELKKQLETAIQSGTPEDYAELARNLANMLEQLKTRQGISFSNRDDLSLAIEAMKNTWFKGSPPPEQLPGGPKHQSEISRLLSDMLILQSFAYSMSRGDLSQSMKIKGMIAGSLKALQAGLRHLTWQTQMIAKGDFSQKVDFMGEFSEAFNSMVASLAEAQDGLKQANRRLEQLVEFITTLLNTIPSPVFYKDTAGKYLGCNRAFEEFLGKSREEIIGKSVYDMAPVEIASKYAEKDQELFERPGSQTYEWKVKAFDGSVREVIFNNATFTDSSENVAGLIGVILDITDRKRAEEEQRHREKLQGVLEMAGAVCHELNQPMQIISGCSEMLLMKISENDPIHTKLDTIIKQIHRMGTITRKLMTIKDYETQDYAGFSRIIDINKSSGTDTE